MGMGLRICFVGEIVLWGEAGKGSFQIPQGEEAGRRLLARGFRASWRDGCETWYP